MMIPRRNILIEIILLFLVLLAFSIPAQAAAQNERSVHKAKVIEHWTPERMKAAKPRDLFLDEHGKAFMGNRKDGFSPYVQEQGQPTQGQIPQGQIPTEQATSADTSDPDISNMFPANNAIIGDSSIFSATVSDNEFESDSGVRTVSIVIQYPSEAIESFRASNTSGNTWSVSLRGFTESQGWSWWVEAKDKAKKGGNRTVSAAFNFDVSTGVEPPIDPPVVPPEEPPSDGVIENAQWTDGGAVQTAAGRIYFEMPGNSKRKGPWGGYVCSGTVVNDSDAIADNGRAIIITAAHCAYDDVNKAFARNVLFIPDQANTSGTRTDSNCDNDPLGCWTPSFAVVDDDWSTRTFPNNIPWDYAYYVVNDADDGDSYDNDSVSDAYSGPVLPINVLTLQAAAGSMPLTFLSPNTNNGDPEPGSNDYTHALGYSYNEDPKFMYCAEDMATVDYISNVTANWWLMHCNLSGGSSGGPWLQPMVDSNNYIISVNSWGYTTEPGMAGPFLYSNSASCLFGIAEGTHFSSIDSTDGEAGVKGPCP